MKTASYFCHAPMGISLSELALAAGERCRIESCFEQAKREVGLDDYKAPSWQGWRRHITMSMIGLLLLNIFTGLGNDSAWGKKGADGCVEHI